MTGNRNAAAGIITPRLGECEQAVGRLTHSGMPGAKDVTRLRAQLGGQLADLVLSVASLQKKARMKLGPENRNSQIWWVTEKSLQQATAWQIAQLKSRWFAARLVYDLCCGIGGDAVHLARRGPLVAVDSDPLVVEMAALNLANSELPAGVAHAFCGDATAIEIPREAAIHIDPDRRAGDDRRSNPVHYGPPWSQVLRVITESESAVVKLAPAAKMETAVLGQMHRCWISLSGTVREQSLLWGEAIGRAGLIPAARSAVSLTSDGSASWFAPPIESATSVKTDIAPRAMSVLVDPDASIRAAGLTEAFASQHGLGLLGKPSGFLTCDDPQSPAPSLTCMAAVGEVIWIGACDDRRLRQEFRSRNAFPVAVKVRGTSHDPAELARRYRRCGDRAVTLWIGRTADRVFAAMTTPCSGTP